MLHKDAREETSCEKLRAGMGVEESHWMPQMTPPPLIRKPVRRMDGPGVFKTGRSSIGCVVRPSDGLGHPWGALFVHRDIWGGRMALYLPGDIMPSPVLVKPLWRRSAAGMLLYIPFRCHGRRGLCTLTDTPTNDIQQFSRSLLAKALRRVPYARKEAYERGW
jgi:hypothetical protein